MKRLFPVLLLSVCLMSCQEKLLDRFEREAEEYTARNCPKQMDSITTLDSIVCRNDGLLNYTYYYTLQLTDEQRKEFSKHKTEIEENTLKAVRNSIELKNVKEAGLNIEYIYLDAETGKTLCHLRFTKEQYK